MTTTYKTMIDDDVRCVQRIRDGSENSSTHCHRAGGRVTMPDNYEPQVYHWSTTQVFVFAFTGLALAAALGIAIGMALVEIGVL